MYSFQKPCLNATLSLHVENDEARVAFRISYPIGCSRLDPTADTTISEECPAVCIPIQYYLNKMPISLVGDFSVRRALLDNSP